MSSRNFVKLGKSDCGKSNPERCFTVFFEQEAQPHCNIFRQGGTEMID